MMFPRELRTPFTLLLVVVGTLNLVFGPSLIIATAVMTASLTALFYMITEG